MNSKISPLSYLKFYNNLLIYTAKDKKLTKSEAKKELLKRFKSK